MTDEPSIIAMDEAGNTGENLLDRDQPVFALAAVHMPEERAQELVDAALSRTQMSELKFSRLRTSNPGRRNILTLLQDAGFTRESAATAAAHKPWMLAAKLVDELVEPAMTEAGIQQAWYGTRAALGMAQVLYTRGPAALGKYYDDLVRAFVPLVRGYTPDTATAFLTALRRCRIVCRDELVKGVLDRMGDTEEALAEEFAEREDALDPAIPLLFYEACHWSEQLGRTFELVHDDSRTIERWKDRFVMVERAQNPEAPMRPVRHDLGGIEVLLPTGLQRITFGQSERDARLQLADVLAGATGHLVAVLSGDRRADQFARDLHRLGLVDRMVRWIGPDFDPAAVNAIRVSDRSRDAASTAS